MASEAPKVRIVRCPKCLKLLPELASVSVYQCGKCGTTLRAKKRKEDRKIKLLRLGNLNMSMIRIRNQHAQFRRHSHAPQMEVNKLLLELFPREIWIPLRIKFLIGGGVQV